MSNYSEARETAIESVLNSLPKMKRDSPQSSEVLNALREVFAAGWSASTAELKASLSAIYDDEDTYSTISLYIDEAEKVVARETNVQSLIVREPKDIERYEID